MSHKLIFHKLHSDNQPIFRKFGVQFFAASAWVQVEGDPKAVREFLGTPLAHSESAGPAGAQFTEGHHPMSYCGERDITPVLVMLSRWPRLSG